MVRSGPHDDWAHRNDPEVAGPLYGPQLPIIEFTHEYLIRAHVTIDRLIQSWPYKRHWERLYPHHPVKR
jgi:hypothetical protein